VGFVLRRYVVSGVRKKVVDVNQERKKGQGENRDVPNVAVSLGRGRVCVSSTAGKERAPTSDAGNSLLAMEDTSVLTKLGIH
jgi:hypothetical protein